MATEVGTVYSVDELLARSKAAAATKASAGGSKIQKMLAGREESDTVDLSPVAKLVKAQKDQSAKTATPYTEQDWYLNAKVAQLKGQIQLYSTLPGLDPGGAVMNQLTKEVNELVTKQRAKMKKSTDEAAAKQAELDRLKAENAAAPMSAEDMLKRAKLRAAGQEIPVETSDAVKAMLEKAKGAVVNKTV